jgi:hypothetical protein
LGVPPFPLPFVPDPESFAVPLVLASAVLAFLPVFLRFCIPFLAAIERDASYRDIFKTVLLSPLRVRCSSRSC